MTRWRKRIGESGAEELLKETIEAGLKLKAVKAGQLKRVNVNTTVQEDALSQVERTGKTPEHVFVDRGYRAYNYKGDTEIHVDKIRKGGKPPGASGYG